jgi:hypothetical protein
MATTDYLRGWDDLPTETAAEIEKAFEEHLYTTQTAVYEDEHHGTLHSEFDHQATVCRVPAAYPRPLLQALLRRGARAMALKNMPLGVQNTITDAGPSAVRVGFSDPEIRRLEAPWRRRAVG